MDAQREVELKLEASPDDLRRLRSDRLVRSLAMGRAVSQSLESVYFDTADHALAAAGLGLRVRRIGARRVQTVKGERSAAAGLFQRAESEVALAGAEPDLARIADPELRARVAEIAEGRQLVAVFRTAFRRTRRVLRSADAEWTLDLDEGEIAAGDRRVPICEVELELRAGPSAALYEFALRLLERFAVRPASRSKAERGYALALGRGAAAHGAQRVELVSDARLEDALVAILAQCLAHFTANADCAAEGADPEGVHQMRVGVRRARAAFAVFEPVLPAADVARFRSELRWLGSELGSARDLDVFTRETLALPEEALAGDPAFKRLCEEAMALRDECYEAVAGLLRSPRYARLALELGALLEARGWRDRLDPEASERLAAPARDFARSLLDRRYRRVVRSAARLGESDEARHRTRIALKKLRYTGEFFRDLFPGSGAKRFLRRTARLQGTLGQMNDVATARRIFETLLERLGEERSAAHDRVAGFVEGWCGLRAEQALRETSEAWERLERARPFWR